jgi:ABC-type nitrate/sulfonate/bicarbonate transport system substrate-binding protein
MKKAQLPALIVALASCLLVLRVDRASSQQVRIGYPSLSLAYWPVWVAHDTGIYEKNNLKVEMVVISGASPLTAALISNQLQFVAQEAVTSVLTAASGAPIKMVLSIQAKMAYQVWSLPEIKHVRDLRGRPISSSRPGTGPHHAMWLVLQKAGLDPARDVTQLPIPGSQSRIAALQSKQVYATILNPPFTSVARKAGLRLLADTGDLDVDYQGIALATVDTLISSNPDAVRRFTNGTLSAFDLMRKEKETAIRAGIKYSKRPRDEVEDGYELLMPALSRSGRINLTGLKSHLQFAADHGLISSPVPAPEGFVDMRFVK